MSTCAKKIMSILHSTHIKLIFFLNYNAPSLHMTHAVCRSYLDVLPHAAGQRGHQYRYCGMSHFSSPPFVSSKDGLARCEIKTDSQRALWLHQPKWWTRSWGSFQRDLLRLRPARSSRRSLQWQPGILCGWSLAGPSPVSAGIYHTTHPRQSAPRLVKRDIWWPWTWNARMDSSLGCETVDQQRLFIRVFFF